MNFVRRVDTDGCLNSFFGSVVAFYFDRDRLERLYSRGQALDIKCLIPGNLQSLEILARFELQRQNSHSYKIAAMDTFEAFCKYCGHTEQSRTFCCPVA